MRIIVALVFVFLSFGIAQAAQCDGSYAANQVCGSVAGGVPGPVTTNNLVGPSTIAAVAHQFLTSYTASSGVFTQAQPAFTDISGQNTLAQLPTIGADTVLGSIAGGTPIALSQTQITTFCNQFTSLLSGCVPLSGGGTSNFLRADGTWTTPAGSGTVSSIALAGGLTGSSNPITSSGTIYAPGGYLNLLRNAPMAVAQRGATALATGSSAPGNYTLDGWQVQQSGAQFTCQQDSTVPASSSGNALFSLRCVGGTSNTDTVIRQPIESSIAAPLAGSVATQGFWYRQDTGSSVTPKLSTCYASATDNFLTCTGDLTSTSLSACATATWCWEGYTLNVSANATKGYRTEIDCNTALTSSQHCWVAMPDLRVTPSVATGVNANPPPPELRPITAELAFCQRYLWAYNSTASANNFLYFGSSLSSTQGFFAVTLPVNMRVPATSISNSAASGFFFTNAAGSPETTTSLTFETASVSTVSFQAVVSSGLTSGQGGVFGSQSSSAQILILGGEL